jgi:hypothetical protein
VKQCGEVRSSQEKVGEGGISRGGRGEGREGGLPKI